ncbi:MAG: hypothetical protein WC539_09405, partial [Nitrospirota bacterium]
MNTQDSITITRISEQEFVGMRDAWNVVLEQSRTKEIFLSWEWMYNWWNVFRDNQKSLYILVGKNPHERLIGIAPWYIEQAGM